MFKRLLLGISLVGLLALSTQEPAAHSQDSGDVACDALVTEALQVLGTACTEVGRNEACYGHSRVAATFREDVDGVTFATSGDTTALTNLEALVTEPLDMDAGTWGVALMRLQADLPESDPDSAMTLILFGDTEVTNAVDLNTADFPTCVIENASLSNMNMRSGPGLNRQITSVFPRGEAGQAVGRSDDNDWVRILYNGSLGWIFVRNMQLDCEIETLRVTDEDAPLTGFYDKPMQAFTLQSGGDSACAAAPNGLLIESPEGQRAHVMVNGIEMEFASAGFLSIDGDGALRVSGLAGEIRVRSAGEMVLLPAGLQTRIPLLEEAIEQWGKPEIPTPLEFNPLNAMPLDGLRDYLGQILHLDIDGLLDLPILPRSNNEGTPRPDGIIPTIVPSVDIRPSDGSGGAPNPLPSLVPPIPHQCAVGDSVTVLYTAVNIGIHAESFTLYLTDGVRHVSEGMRINVSAGATVSDTVTLMINQSIPATIGVVTAIAELDGSAGAIPNLVVTAVGSLICTGG
ncbi:MAG: SH3 domain-containing protein [Anaerolineales bacterium]|nr:SH3 domain-containing protein [Anaerolineales bacterium]